MLFIIMCVCVYVACARAQHECVYVQTSNQLQVFLFLIKLQVCATMPSFALIIFKLVLVF